MRIASLAFEILPLVALFIGNSIYNIFIGAAASVGLAAVILLFTWLKEKRLARFVIFSRFQRKKISRPWPRPIFKANGT